MKKVKAEYGDSATAGHEAWARDIATTLKVT
jgi:hypothetical protein